MSEANSKQVGGNHYRKTDGEQHWDRLIRLYGWERAKIYFIGNITAYVERHEDKNGVEDLEKALHYTQKMIEEERKHQAKRSYVGPSEKNPDFYMVITPEQAKEWWHPYSSPEEAVRAMSKGLHPILQRATCSENPYEVIAKEQEEDHLRHLHKSNEDFEARVCLPPREKGNANVESTKE